MLKCPNCDSTKYVFFPRVQIQPQGEFHYQCSVCETYFNSAEHFQVGKTYLMEEHRLF